MFSTKGNEHEQPKRLLNRPSITNLGFRMRGKIEVAKKKKLSWDLRQEDPLSSYLFVIGMEALSCLIDRAVEGSFLSVCSLGGRTGEKMAISHFLYADVTLLFLWC